MGKKHLLLIVLTLGLISLILTGCGGGEDAAKDDTAQAGEQLFNQAMIGTTAGCKTCHSLKPDAVIVGPSLAGVASRSGDRVPGIAAEDYLRQSILEPNAYLVEGFPANVMPKVWGDQLSRKQIDSLVKYLLTLK